VVVGRVESIVFDDKTFQARATLALESRYQFPKDSSLKILTSGLLGEQYIGIEAGSDEKNLAQGDTITTTQSAVVLENLIGQFLYNKAADRAPTPTHRQGVHRRNDEPPDRPPLVAPAGPAARRSRCRRRLRQRPQCQPARSVRAAEPRDQQFNEGVDSVLLKPTATLYRERCRRCCAPACPTSSATWATPGRPSTTCCSSRCSTPRRA
jgi:hypothetical protein